MTLQPSPDLLDLAEAVAVGTLRADDAERQLRLALGSERSGESEQAVSELRGLIGAAGAVRAHARATREAFGSASPHVAPTVATTPASIVTLVPGRVTASAVHPRSSNGGDGAGRAPRRTWLLAAAALLLIGGAMAAGSGLVKLPPLVPPVPAPTLPVAVASPSPAVETPSPVVSPSPPETPWITGQQLADLLSSEAGYTWVSVDQGDGRTVLQLDKPQADGTTIEISPPFDGRATVRVGFELEPGAETLAPDVDRIAQALAPDTTTWIRDAFNQGIGTPGGGSAARDTANGGSLGVSVVDEFWQDWAYVWFSPDPLPPVRTAPIAPGSVVYADSGLIRVANPDGTDAGTLLGGASDPRVPGAHEVERVIGWSPDGSRLFYLDAGGGVWSTDARGSKPTMIGRPERPSRCEKQTDAALKASCEAWVDRVGIPELCPRVAVGDHCRADVAEILISPDGRRLAYPIDDGRGVDKMGFLDLATGQVTRVAMDLESGPGGPGCEGPFGDGPLLWSPDGTRFVFGQSVGPKVDGWCQGAVFTINVDGTDLRRVTPPSVHAVDPRWSPDGATIVFRSPTPRSAWDGRTDATRIPIDYDIYSVRPDGSGLRALTSDGVSILLLSTTRDGRIVFTRNPNPEATGELWIMDADGANATRLDTTIAAQTAAGCTVCPYPDDQGRFVPNGGGPYDSGPFLRFWRPGQP
jgi:hypothetical protein